jgi:hypothetical protein
MTAKKADAYQTDPDYIEAMQNFQVGDWKSGLVKLKGILDSYPYSSELRSLFYEMQLRARVEIYEREDKKIAIKSLIKRVLLVMAALVVVSFLALWGFQSSAEAISQQWQAAMAQITEQSENIELQMKFANAERLMDAYYLAEARDLFLDVKAEQND